MSSAKLVAVWYRRVRSLSIAFITIRSMSPASSERRRLGSIARCCAAVVISMPAVLSRVLGFGGSTSRMMRRISSIPALKSVLSLNGLSPVTVSYSRTPSE